MQRLGLRRASQTLLGGMIGAVVIAVALLCWTGAAGANDDLSSQIEVYETAAGNAHCADIWATPASQCSPPTARPGHSLHETGRAIDFYTDDQGARKAITSESPEFDWLDSNAERFGLFNLPPEPWHWSTTGG